MRKLPKYWKICEACGERFEMVRPDKPNRYCSQACTRSRNGGHNRKPEVWWSNQKGYIEGRVWANGVQRQVKQHRWVIEQAIHRRLERDEHVHHINGEKADNRIENLEIVHAGEHSHSHNLRRIYRRGYKLNLSDAERAARAERMRRVRRSGGRDRDESGQVA